MATCPSTCESYPGASRPMTYRCTLPAGHTGPHRAPSGSTHLDDTGHVVSSGSVSWRDDDSGTVLDGSGRPVR